MMILVTFFKKKIENFAFNSSILVKKKSNYHGFFCFLKIALRAAKTRPCTEGRIKYIFSYL